MVKMSGMEEPVFKATEEDLKTPNSARQHLSKALDTNDTCNWCKTEKQVIEYLEGVNDITKETLSNCPYFLTEFLTCSSSWACGVILGWLCKNHFFTEVSPHELAACDP